MKKLGLHIIGSQWDPNALGRPPIVKVVNVDPEYVQRVRAAVGPNCLIVVRWAEDGQYDWSNPAVAARDWYERHYPAMCEMADSQVVFEGANEIADSNAPALRDFELERLERLHAMGWRCAVGSWSVGCPALETWPIYQPVLDAIRPSDVVALHEYWPDTAGIDNRYFCARWSLVPALFGRPLIVTECGRDVVEGKGAPGWQRTCDADTFVKDLLHYDALLCQWPNVLGATVFTAGLVTGWEAFSVNGIWARVIAEQEEPKDPFEPPTMPLPSEPVQDIRNAAWNALGVPLNPDAAFYRYAQTRGLGKPETPELDVSSNGRTYRYQGFAGGIVYCVVGDWGNLCEVSW